MAFLPIVSPEVRFSVSESLNDYSKDKDTVKIELKKIEEENPIIFQFIKKWVGECKKYKIPIALCGIIVYKLLRSQAEADYLSETLNI